MTDFYENRAGLDTLVLAQELKKRSSLWQEYVLLDEVDSTNEFIKKMEITEGSSKVWLILRLGYSETPSKSPRLEVTDILI